MCAPPARSGLGRRRAASSRHRRITMISGEGAPSELRGRMWILRRDQIALVDSSKSPGNFVVFMNVFGDMATPKALPTAIESQKPYRNVV
eukprot:2392562-Prymnesium_polylepis.1